MVTAVNDVLMNTEVTGKAFWVRFCASTMETLSQINANIRPHISVSINPRGHGSADTQSAETNQDQSSRASQVCWLRGMSCVGCAACHDQCKKNQKLCFQTASRRECRFSGLLLVLTKACSRWDCRWNYENCCCSTLWQNIALRRSEADVSRLCPTFSSQLSPRLCKTGDAL